MDRGRVRYLSLDWISALTEEVGASDTLAALAGDHELGFTQVVTDGPEGTVTYHLQVADGDVRFGAGAAEPEDVRFEQSWETAVAVATGELAAQEAFITGRILLFGDQQAVLGAQPVFRELEQVFRSVRARTEYK